MVLQRGITNPLWGWELPQQALSLRVEGGAHPIEVTGRAGADGRFRLPCPELAAGGPYRLVLRGSGEVVVEDVVVGEVWLASGQSNMEWPLATSDGAAEILKLPREPRVRTFKVPRRFAEVPELELEGSWKCAEPRTVGAFSAIGYFFARELVERLDVPVGIIDATWGGTRVEAWMSPAAARASIPGFDELMARREAERPELPRLRAEYRARLADWERRSFPADPGNRGVELGWHRPDFDDTAFRTMSLPGFWQSEGLRFNGVVWFRREIWLPESMAGRELEVELGAIDDYDHSYWDGEPIGAHPDGTPDAYQLPRSYRVPAHLATPGRHVLAVRVFDHFGEGGFVGPAAAMRLGSECTGWLPLDGAWRFEVEHELPLVPATIFADYPTPPPGVLDQNALSALFFGMTSPLVGYGMRGALWYQGESNVDAPECYAARLVAMIRDLRTRWGLGQFPFYQVQLANFRNNGAWAWLREAQQQATAEPNTALAVTLDVGHPDDIHPRNKLAVGHRLALLARAQIYGETGLAAESPRLRHALREGQGMRVSFTPELPLTTSDGKMPRGFELSGPNGVFVAAQAEIQGSQVVVTSEAIPEPHAVRYAFSDCPSVNLQSREGLPVAPFRTDGAPPR